jgi:hypothetical protein
LKKEVKTKTTEVRRVSKSRLTRAIVIFARPEGLHRPAKSALAQHDAKNGRIDS